MGLLFQPGGEREGEMEFGIGLESREAMRERQETSQPLRVTREALNIAERLMANRDLKDNSPNCLS